MDSPAAAVLKAMPIMLVVSAVVAFTDLETPETTATFCSKY
jgi:hypothetical protein